MQKNKRNYFISLSVFLMLISNISYSQIIDDFCSFAKKRDLIKNRIYYFKDANDNSVKQQIIFLGEIELEDKSVFKVFTSFVDLGTKGVSKLIFTSANEKIYEYIMDLPLDLPFKVFKNKLYFKNKETKEIKSMRVNVLKAIFCTPFECF